MFVRFYFKWVILFQIFFYGFVIEILHIKLHFLWPTGWPLKALIDLHFWRLAFFQCPSRDKIKKYIFNFEVPNSIFFQVLVKIIIIFSDSIICTIIKNLFAMIYCECNFCFVASITTPLQKSSDLSTKNGLLTQ